MKGVDLLPIYIQDVPVTTPGLDVPKRLEIDDALYERATNQCPSYLSTTGFINLILDQGLAGGARLIEPSRDRQPDERGEGSISSSSSSSIEDISIKKKNKNNTRAKDPFASKNLDGVSIPDEIVDCDQLFREYWSVKKGTRSESVFNRICCKLAAWTPEDRRKALEAAANAGWADVYEPRSTPSTSTRPVGIVPTPALSPQMQKWINS